MLGHLFSLGNDENWPVVVEAKVVGCVGGNKEYGACFLVHSKDVVWSTFLALHHVAGVEALVSLSCPALISSCR